MGNTMGKILSSIKKFFTPYELFVDDMVINWGEEEPLDEKIFIEPNSQLWDSGSDRLEVNDIAYKLYLMWYKDNSWVALHGDYLITRKQFDKRACDGKCTKFLDEANIIIRSNKIKKIINKLSDM